MIIRATLLFQGKAVQSFIYKATDKVEPGGANYIRLKSKFLHEWADQLREYCLDSSKK